MPPLLHQMNMLIWKVSCLLSVALWAVFFATRVSAVNTFTSDSARLSYIEDTYDFSGSYNLKRLVRPGFEDDLNYVIDHTDDTDTVKDYALGVGLWPMVAVGVGVLFLLSIPIVCACRCCGNCFASPNRKPPTSLMNEDCNHCPSITLLVLLCISAALGYIGVAFLIGDNVYFSRHVDDVPYHFLQLNKDIRAKATELGEDMDAITAAVDGSYTNISQLVNDTESAITVGISDVSAGLEVQSSVLQDVWIRSYVCSKCNTLGEALGVANQIVENAADPVLYELRNIRSEIEDSFVEMRSSLDEAILEAKGHLDDAVNTTLDIDQDVDDYEEYLDYWDRVRLSVVATTYSVIAVILIGAFAFVACGRGKYASVFGYLILVFSFLNLVFLAVHTGLFTLLVDVCDMTSKREQSLDSIFPDTDLDSLTDPSRTPARALMTCLCDENVITTFNYTSELSFRDRIQFPDTAQTSPDEYLDFDTIYDYLDQIKQVNISDFNYSTVTTDQKLAEVNDLTTPDVFTRENISDLDPSGYGGGNMATLTALKADLVEAVLAEAEIAVFLANLTSNATALEEMIATSRTNVITAQEALLRANETLEPAFLAVDDLTEDATCGFIGTFYYKIKRTTCSRLVGTTGGMSFGSFLIFVAMLIAAPYFFYIDTRGMVTYQRLDNPQSGPKKIRRKKK